MLIVLVSRLPGIGTTPHTPTRERRLADPSAWDARWVVGVLALHVVIGIVGRASEPFSTAYDVLTICAAIVVAVRARRLEYVAAAVGYVTSAEVFWRMTAGTVFWPATGKFALSGLLVLAMFRFFPGWRRAILPALYLAMFVPGVILAVRHFGLASSRGPVAFNLMGPVSLAACVLFFSQVRLRLEAFRLVLWALVPPIVAMASNIFVGTISSGSIRFTEESNFATSGDFMPTQVSAVLGFGVLVCVLLAVNERNLRLRLVEVGLALLFLGQALLTFARGGVVSMLVALFLAVVVAARPLRRAGRVVLVSVVVAAVAAAAIFVVVNSFSGGKLTARYDENELTHRGTIFLDDLRQFREHPLFGVGIGVAHTNRPPEIRDEEAHTEFSRLLGEQGLFGGVALAVLVTILVLTFRRARPGMSRALFMAFAAWSVVEMLHSATRIALISYAFGLAVAAAGLVAEDAEPAPERPPRNVDVELAAPEPAIYAAPTSSGDRTAAQNRGP
jgi:O-antigen ligase